MCRIFRTEHRPRHVRNPKHPQGIYHSVQADGTAVYEVRVQDGTGRRRFEVVGTRFDQTKARLAELTHLVQRGGRTPSASLKVADLLDEWWALKRPHVREGTRVDYERQIRKIRDSFGR